MIASERKHPLGLLSVILTAAIAVATLYLGAAATKKVGRTPPARPQQAIERVDAATERDDWERRHIVALLRGQGLRPGLAETIADRILARRGTTTNSSSAAPRP